MDKDNLSFTASTEVVAQVLKPGGSRNIELKFQPHFLPKVQTAHELLEEETSFESVFTYISELNLLFKDLLLPAAVTEICGLPGSGKTQVCLHLSVGVNGQVVFIHTNNNLNSERLEEIVSKCGCHRRILDNMLCIEASSPLELVASIRFLENWFEEKKIKLLIIDSLAWPLKQLHFLDRTHFVCSLFQDLRNLAGLYTFSIIVTNDLTLRKNGDETFNTSLFGNSFYHFINNRILLGKRDSCFNAKVCKSITGCLDEIVFRIS